MSDFIDQLKSVSKTPEQIQEEKMQAQRRKEENDALALEKCKKNFAEEIARRIKSDAIGKAKSGKYENAEIGKIISGAVELDISPSFSDGEGYSRLFNYYTIIPDYKVSIKEQKQARYVSWLLSKQNLRYKQGKAVWVPATMYSRVDKYVLTPLAKEIIGIVRKHALEDDIEIGTRFFIQWEKDGKVVRTEECDNQDEVIVKEGFYEKHKVKVLLNYCVKY